MKTFILMGILCAISAAIASARLNGGSSTWARATSCT